MAPRLPCLDGIPRDIAAVGDYPAQARPRLDDNAWAYLTGGAADELTLAWNRQAYDQLALRPRVLRPVAGGHTRLNLLGRELPHPILLAPVAWQKLFHPQGEVATAYAAAAVDALLVLSTLASTPLEEVARVGRQAGPGGRWFQLYWQADRGVSRHLVERAAASGYEAIVLTVDAPVNGVRNREQRAGFALPAGVTSANLVPYPVPPEAPLAAGQSIVFDQLMVQAPTWDDLEWLRGCTDLPIVVKGVLHPEDAVQAARSGAAAVIVSNHGGRTLDTLPASLEVLPEIADALGGSLPILVDGGISRGTDVFKAIALGATAVLVGRAYIHALAAAGPLGIAHVLRVLQDELAVAMALCGCATLAEIGPQHVRSAGVAGRR